MSFTESEVDLKSALEAVADGRALSAAEAEATFDSFMNGSAPEIQMAGFLVGLEAKGVEPSEVAGGVRALRKVMVPVAASDPSSLVDTAGTGGGGVTTFNISTAAAIVTAGAGVPVAKHGNRSFTSRSGSADVLEALGVGIQLTADRMSDVLEEAGIVFMFAPLLHPAMRHVGPVRKALGITTIMNILGRLTNPAGARRQVIGVADPTFIDLIAGALLELGHIRALIVHGEPGMDEVSPAAGTRVAELREGVVRDYEINPEDLGVESVELGEIAGGEPSDNAAIIEEVLQGESGPPRAAVVVNAAAALFVSGVADSLSEGARLAEISIDGGAAMAALDRLRLASN